MDVPVEIRGRGRTPGRRLVVLIESRSIDLAAVERVADDAPFDIVVCTGPAHPGDACPLVVDGECPQARPDVVVCEVCSEWRPSVVAAWRERGVVVATNDTGEPLEWPAHIGVAIGALYRACLGA